MSVKDIAVSRRRAAGTGFPVSPASGDKFYRSDRNIEYFYDGTRWLSTQIFVEPLAAQEVLASQTASTVGDVGRNANPWAGLYDIWLETVAFCGFVDGASASWTMKAYSKTGGDASVLIASSGEFTANATSDTVRVAVNALQASTIDSFSYNYTENSGTASFTGAATLIYRLVG